MHQTNAVDFTAAVLFVGFFRSNKSWKGFHATTKAEIEYKQQQQGEFRVPGVALLAVKE